MYRQNESTTHLNDDILKWLSKFSNREIDVGKFKADIGVFEGIGRGMRAKCEILKGEEIISVPIRSMTINIKVVLEDRFVQVVGLAWIWIFGVVF